MRHQPAGGPPPDFFSSEVAQARRFYLNLNPPPTRPLSVVCGGLEVCTPHYAIHRTSFPFYSVEYVWRGRGTLQLGKRRHPLHPGRIFSYGPGIPHRIQTDPADPLVKYFVDFAGPAGPKLLRKARLAPGRIAGIFPPHELQGLFDELIRCGSQGGRQGQTLGGRLLECLLLKIAAAPPPLADGETRAFATYQQCRQHLHTHFLRLKTLAEIARECHLDAAYLCRLFRRYDRQTPYQVLLRLKLNSAAELLQQPGALVKQVAEAIGFSDAFHFSRTFKRAFGMSPEAFRKLR